MGSNCYAEGLYRRNFYAMSPNILNAPTGTRFAGFFYTNKSKLQ
jgi:hypothetical protein